MTTTTNNEVEPDTFEEPPKIETPPPGIYEGVPFDTYRAWKAINHSRLNKFRRSPAHYEANEDVDTAATQFGRFFHAGALEPDTVENLYRVLPPYNLDEANVVLSGAKKGQRTESWGTKYCRTLKEAFHERAEREGCEVVTRDKKNEMLAMVRAIANHERASSYLSVKGRNELSLLWKCDLTGLLCKARIDHETDTALNDLKSCEDARWFESDMRKRNYHSQAAWYQGGYSALAGEIKPFNLIAVEKSKPHGIRAAPVGEASLIVGNQSNYKALQRLAECIATDTWPGYEQPEAFDAAGIDVDDVLDWAGVS